MAALALILASAALAFQAAGGGALVSKEGGFRVDMPGKPTDRPQQMDTPFGPIEGRSFSSVRGKLAFQVSYSDYPPNVPDFLPDKVLERSVHGGVGNIPGAILQAKSDVKLGDVPGKEFDFSYQAKGGDEHLCRAQLYLSGLRLYSIIVRGPANDVARVAPVYFRSFSLFPPEARPAAPAPPPRPESPLTTKPGAAAKAVATRAFTSAAGRFRVAMPGKPQERTIVQQVPDGAVEAHLFVVVVDDVRRLVSYIDRPKPLPADEVDAGLEDLVKGSIISGKGTLVAKRPIRLGEAPGREFEFDSVGLDGRPRFVRARAYLVDARIYQLLIAGPKAKVAGAAGDAYLDSFALIVPGRPASP